MNEYQTRKEFIGKALLKAKWQKDGEYRFIEEFHMEKRWGNNKDIISEPDPPYQTKNEYADYLLLGRDEQPVAIKKME